MNDASLIVIAVIVSCAIFTWIFPEVLLPVIRLWAKAAYRFRAYNTDVIPHSGPAVIVSNHVSYIDWLFLCTACPRATRFVIWTGFHDRPWLRFLLSWARNHILLVDNRATDPLAVEGAVISAARALERGEILVVFPEGRLTRNGQMLPFGRGLDRILKRTSCEVPIIPTCLSGLWGSVWSYRDGRIFFKLPRGIRNKVSVYFGKPLPASTSIPEIRAAVVEAEADRAIAEKAEYLAAPRWFVRTACSFRNLFRIAFVDVATGTERKLSFSQGLVGCWCLSSWLRRRLGTATADPIGLWLPTGLGSTFANIALSFLRLTTVNLNYTAGRSACESAARQVKMKFVITARRFEARVPLELPEDIERIYLEDALAGISKVQKLTRMLLVVLLPSRIIERMIGIHRIQPDDMLTIIFSSGSTGEPKGVMLSQANIASNAHSFEEGVDIHRQDVMLSSLPFFHSFGYTVNLWAPVGIGCKSVYYPDPRAAKEVGELVQKHKCTVMVGTATFLRFYIRRCKPDDFKSVRLLICGAEKLPVKLANEFQAKFGILPLEGYGCTEVSPVVSTNIHDVDVAGLRQTANMMGTVGQPIPGVAAKAFDAETLAPLPPATEGLIGVKGPNVMLGYYGQPERTAKVILDGWYQTGDMGLIEPTGFIRITGRISRFAKIAGEMVPLEKLEEEMQDLYGTGERLVTVCPVSDERRGEKLVVLFLPEAEEKLDWVLSNLSKRGLPNLWVPDKRDCYRVEAFPALGSGKLDLRGLTELAVSLAQK